MNKNKIIWLKDCGKKIWEGFLQHIGVTLFIVISSAVYLFLNQIKKFQDFVSGIPTSWVLSPLVLLLIVLIALIIINRKQQKRISVLEKEPIKDERDARMVTHCGVWWKIYLDSEYIEDFPYCTCCAPPKKLSQIEWYPDEIFQCPITKAQFKLFGEEVPLKRQRVVDGLYRAYFRGLDSRIERSFFEEHRRIKELNPQIPDSELFDKLFLLFPLNRIPKGELEDIRKRYPNPIDAFHFIDRHFNKYKEFFKKS
jgi:hypothetical protein